MKIYVAHSKTLNYKENLYQPIRKDSDLKDYTIILPHEEDDTCYNTRDFYKSLSVIIAEVSYPATGMGIELGWAYDDNVPVYCLYKKGSKVSSSLKSVSNHFIEYNEESEMLEIIKEIIKKEKL